MAMAACKRSTCPNNRSILTIALRVITRPGPTIRTTRSTQLPMRAAQARLTATITIAIRSEEHTSELQSHLNLVCRLLLEKKKIQQNPSNAQTQRSDCAACSFVSFSYINVPHLYHISFFFF